MIEKLPTISDQLQRDSWVLGDVGKLEVIKSQFDNLTRDLIALYARLMARGKAHNAALVACARKLLIYANTVVERGTPWVERTAAT